MAGEKIEVYRESVTTTQLATIMGGLLLSLVLILLLSKWIHKIQEKKRLNAIIYEYLSVAKQIQKYICSTCCWLFFSRPGTKDSLLQSFLRSVWIYSIIVITLVWAIDRNSWRTVQISSSFPLGSKLQRDFHWQGQEDQLIAIFCLYHYFYVILFFHSHLLCLLWIINNSKHATTWIGNSIMDNPILSYSIWLYPKKKSKIKFVCKYSTFTISFFSFLF